MIADFILNGTNTTPVQTVIMLIMLIVGAFLSITVHEYAHAKISGESKPSLNPLKQLTVSNILSVILLAILSVSWTKSPNVNKELPKGKRILIALSGIAANLIVAIVCVFIYEILVVIGANIYASNYTLGSVYMWIETFFSEMVLINIAYAVFNLIPVPSTDGGLVVSSLLSEKASEKFDSFGRFGYIILVFLAVIAFRSGASEIIINLVANAIEAPFLAIFNLIFPV